MEHADYFELDYAGKILGWIICRRSENGDVSNLLYGKFTKSEFPPQTGWTFLGNYVKRKFYFFVISSCMLMVLFVYKL